MIIWITFFSLALVQVGAAGVLGSKLPRLGVWLIMLASVFLIHWVSLNESGFMRMVLICSVLMASMKMITYREWCAAGNMKLRYSRWLLFSCLWFGMDPAAFVTRRSVEWKIHAIVGSLCVIFGLLGVWLCYLLDVRNVVILFICMSAGFHFGLLRLMTAFWRMQGFPVRVLFRNPLMMRGFRDFWGKRWNLSYSFMMARAVKKPLTPMLGEKGSMFAVFVVSGLFHELAITIPVGAGYGWPTLFFVLHGILCLLENRNSMMMAVLCGVVLILGVPFLFGEKFKGEIILPARNVLEYIE